MAGIEISSGAPNSIRDCEPLSVYCSAVAIGRVSGCFSEKLKMAQRVDRKFPAFPYEPYTIQIDFMDALYKSLDKGGISILESPTGTGKTLSIICSTLQWLADQKENRNTIPGNADQNGLPAEQSNSDEEPDWMKNFVVHKNNQVDAHQKPKKKYEASLIKIERRKNGERHKNLSSEGAEDVDLLTVNKSVNMPKNDAEEELDDKEFILDDYESEDDGITGGGKWKRKSAGVSISSSSDEDLNHSDIDDEEGHLKVYFCSRTHSQLSQFVKELKKTTFANSTKVVCLGSRKNFCINEDVLRLGSTTRINERCLELQKIKKSNASKAKNLCTGVGTMRKKAASGCPLLRKHKLQRQFKDQLSLQGAMDIEDLVHLGYSIGTCPYYGSRSMVSTADLVILPYQSLLSKSSRESLGLNLKNSVIIIDEAHNLADSLISMYDSKITLSQLEDVHFHLEKYLERFHNLLGHGNRRHIQTLLVITQGFIRTLKEDCKDTASCHEDVKKFSDEKLMTDSSMAIYDFLFALNIDNINFLKLLNYIKESNVIHKVSGYGSKLSTQQTDSTFSNNQAANEDGSTLSSFRKLSDMLLSLTYKNGDGRIIISRSRTTPSGQVGGYIKYVMLTGEKIFSEIADEAHAVILAGGTLQPVEETRERLFPWLPIDQLNFFSCNHIVPRESILPVAVSRGPTGQLFDFSYSARSSSVMIEELGLLICNLVSVIPEGIVVFFSSFDYEDQVYNMWKASGILERFKRKKRVFREPRKSSEVEQVLKEYKEAIDASSSGNLKDSTHGAIFLAVVGGKVSEGINFSDGMGRCIVMVGLPYPNPSDIELMERIKHIDGLRELTLSVSKSSVMDEISSKNAQAGFQVLRSCGHKGKAYYENLCMKAVNQSIGRAIRHRGDYAAILLVDSRYASDPSKKSQPRPTEKLPRWIKDSFIPWTNNYGEVHRLLHQFFKLNKK
ncbi:hypothetical protein SAY86_026366 [Trapa natans]|uniref:Helicase ATP-binding domain-containing protein n=1 Tax=Trapa natans TaxID=22666 RepID=A0AAN7KJN6_TRANT|nr:hypothetical protein SAY86_026366 [Trapa natans]